MGFSLSDSIGKKIFALVCVPVVACLIITLMGLVSLKVLDRTILLARAERDHTTNFYKASVYFQEYVRNPDSELYKKLPIHYVGTPLMDESGNVTGAVLYITDVSELKKIEVALQHANDFLQGRISDATANITSATSQILASASEQASTASEQSAAVAQTSSTVEQVRQTARQSAERAREVARMAHESAREAEQGFSAVEGTLEGVTTIREQVESIAENILSLSEKTQQIGEIIDTVNDMADQSNLLALNAAIEAAAQNLSAMTEHPKRLVETRGASL